MPAVTLKTYRREYMREMGGSAVFTTTGTGSAGPPSTIVCTTLKSTALPATALAYRWVFVPSMGATPRQRRVIKTGLSIGSGAISCDDVLGAVVGSGVEFEIHSWQPAVDDQTRSPDIISGHECINLALRDLWVMSYVDLTTVAGQQEYSLAILADYLDREDSLIDVLDPPRRSGWPRESSRIRWKLKLDGGTPTLQARSDRAYDTTGDTFQVVVKRPAHPIVNGTGEVSALSAETDTGLASVTEVVTVAKMYALRALSEWRELPEPERARYTAQAVDQEVKVRRLEHYDDHSKREIVAPAPAAGAA